jgi:hypothetical protein
MAPHTIFQETFQTLNGAQGEDAINESLLIGGPALEEGTVAILGEHTGTEESFLSPNVFLNPFFDSPNTFFDWFWNANA